MASSIYLQMRLLRRIKICQLRIITWQSVDLKKFFPQLIGRSNL